MTPLRDRAVQASGHLPPGTLVLHVGIHKTASTYIQHRLKRNHSFLRQQGIFYPKRRRDHRRLVKALRQGNLFPWDRLLDQAQRKGCRPLISAEVLSLVLAQQSKAMRGSVLSELLAFLHQRGIQLELVAFVRDQPAYLNSRYTQLIKRFFFAISFERYIARTMRFGGESACDFEALFGEALSCDRLRCTILPFRAGEGDPCERLLQAVGVSSFAGMKPLDQRVNAQPGWQAVWLARRIARKLSLQHPKAWHSTACKTRIRKALDHLAIQQGWLAQPFQGLNDQLLTRLEDHYGASNERFAQRVWGCSWRDVFPRPSPQPSPRAPRNRAERRELVALADRLLAEAVGSEGG